MSCTVCSHPQRQAIDTALLARTATLAQLSEQHHLSTSALHRHQQHLLQKMPHVQMRFQEIINEGLLLILNSFLHTIMDITRTATAEGNSRQVLQATRQGTAIMRFMQKLGFSLTTGTLHRLLSSPQGIAPDGLLPTDPAFSHGSRQALADYLFAPCPEPGSSQDTALDPGLPGLADLDGLNQEQLLNLLSALKPSAGQPQEEAHQDMREKGGKKPGKTTFSTRNIKQFQEDNSCAKNAGKLSPAMPSKDGLQPQPSSLPGPLGSPLTGPQAPEPTSSWIQDQEEGRLDVNILPALGAGRSVDLDLASSTAV